MPAKALFLDFDGLICDTERAARQSWRDLYARFGLDFPAASWAAMIGHADGERVASTDLAARLGRELQPTELAWRRRRKQELADAEPPRPGITGLLTAAAQRGIPAAVVSSSPLSWVAPHLARTNLRRLLAFLVTGDEVAAKPAPDLYLTALRRAAVPASAAVAFEDSPTGVRAARAAGICCVAVPSAASSPAQLTAATWTLSSVEHFDLDTDLPAETGFCPNPSAETESA